MNANTANTTRNPQCSHLVLCLQRANNNNSNNNNSNNNSNNNNNNNSNINNNLIF